MARMGDLDSIEDCWVLTFRPLTVRRIGLADQMLAACAISRKFVGMIAVADQATSEVETVDADADLEQNWPSFQTLEQENGVRARAARSRGVTRPCRRARPGQVIRLVQRDGSRPEDVESATNLHDDSCRSSNDRRRARMKDVVLGLVFSVQKIDRYDGSWRPRSIFVSSRPPPGLQGNRRQRPASVDLAVADAVLVQATSARTSACSTPDPARVVVLNFWSKGLPQRAFEQGDEVRDDVTPERPRPEGISDTSEIRTSGEKPRQLSTTRSTEDPGCANRPVDKLRPTPAPVSPSPRRSPPG